MKIPKVVLSVLGLLLILMFTASFYFYSQYKKTKDPLASPQAMTKQQVDELVKKVGLLIELPKEEPTVGTVLDKTKLKDQGLFARAENGDKVLIFIQARKAILYRQKTNKIIEVGPVNIGPQATASANTRPSPTKTLNVRVAVYNGTKTAGLAAAYADQIQTKFSNVVIVLKTNATGDFSKTIVVDLTGKNRDLVQNIAQSLSGEVSNLPQGEEKPAADILVIAGK